MLKGYRGDWFAAQQALRAWYRTELGQELNAAILRRTESLVGDLYALRCLQIGGTQLDADLLIGRNLVCRIHITGDGHDDLCAQPLQLPLASRSIDLVLLGHALDFCADPHALLREVDRVLTLDGYLVVICFNPFSLFGLRRLWGRGAVPWSGSFYSLGRMSDWLRVLGLELRRHDSCWLRPPLRSRRARRLTAAIERAAPILSACGGVQLLLARKQSIPMTPIPLGNAVADATRARGSFGPANRVSGEGQWHRS